MANLQQTVEAFAASWIEMLMKEKIPKTLVSKPLRLRGLKYAITQSFIILIAVEAFAASWIEIHIVRRSFQCF